MDVDQRVAAKVYSASAFFAQGNFRNAAQLLREAASICDGHSTRIERMLARYTRGTHS